MKKFMISYEYRVNEFMDACEEMNLDDYELEDMLNKDILKSVECLADDWMGDTYSTWYATIYYQRYYIQKEATVEEIDKMLDVFRDKYDFLEKVYVEELEDEEEE